MSANSQADLFLPQREHMVAFQLRARGITEERILDVMACVPRHEFVPPEFRSQAYEDHPLPIGQGQTISQPYIVALMLQALMLDPRQKVLEVGTGSGYQTALLGELAAQVYSIERHAALANGARQTLTRLGYSNVMVFVGDGSQGLPALAPFDAIIVSAAASEIPPILFQQLEEGGRMLLPVGPQQAQELQLVRKREGQAVITILEGCRFVPLVSGPELEA